MQKDGERPTAIFMQPANSQALQCPPSRVLCPSSSISVGSGRAFFRLQRPGVSFNAQAHGPEEGAQEEGI